MKLTLALSKGRIFEETAEILSKIGIVPKEDPEKSRKLIIETSNPDVRLIIVRASDVPTYVQFGGADFGVAGLDVLMETGTECLPTKIPEQIEVDVSVLKIGDTIHIKDIKVAEGIKIMNSPDDIVLSVVPPAKEEAAAAPLEGEEVKTEPEVIREKKVAPEDAQGD